MSRMLRYIERGVWTRDIESFPDTPEHRLAYPHLYTFTYNGYVCEVKRNFNLCWCGYVTIPKTHPDFEKGYDDVDIYPHGGMTYANEGKFGFDCSHAGDISPTFSHPLMYTSGFNSWGSYKDRDYVINEIKQMVDEFKQRENKEDSSTGTTSKLVKIQQQELVNHKKLVN